FPFWGRTAIRARLPSRRRNWWRAGAPCSSTTPICARKAVSTAFAVRRAWRRAAPAAPSRLARRVFTWPATGARANTTTAGRERAITDWSPASRPIEPLEAIGRRAEEVEQPQPPHEENGAEDATALPAPARRERRAAQAGRPPLAPHELAERDVFHERDLGKAVEGLAAHEDRLVAGRDAGQARADIHGCGHDAQHRVLALDAHVEAAPGAIPERPRDRRRGPCGQARIGMQENERLAASRPRTRVHLARPSARRDENAVAMAARLLRRAVGAAAVDDDDLMAGAPQRRE